MEKTSSARKTSSLPTKIYTYGITRIQPEAEKLIQDQLWLAHRYRNKLTEIERNRRTDYRKLRASLSTIAESLEQENEAIDAKIVAARQQLQAQAVARWERQEDSVAKSLIETIQALKNERARVSKEISAEFARVEREHFQSDGEALAQRKQYHRLVIAEQRGAVEATQHLLNMKQGNWDKKGIGAFLKTCKIGPHVLKQTNELAAADMQNSSAAWMKKQAIESKAYNAVRAARSACGCFPGVYLKVEDAADRAFKDSPFLPRFSRFDGSGLVAVQSKDVTTEVAMSCRNDLIKIEVFPDIKLKMKHQKAAVAHIRLGEAGTQKAYVTVSFVLHRPLPANAVIKWVWIRAKRIGTRTKYDLQFTIESESFLYEDDFSSRNGSIAVNLGWKALSNGDIRVATTYDGNEYRTVELPVEMRDQQTFSELLLKHSDDHFNVAKKHFAQWVRNHSDDLDRQYIPERYSEGRIVPLRRPGVQESEYTPVKLNDLFSHAANWNNHGRLVMAGKVLSNLYLDEERIRVLWNEWKAERLGSTIEQNGRQMKLDLFAPFEELSTWFAMKGVSDANAQMALYLNWWSRKERHLISWARNTQNRLRLCRQSIYRNLVATWSRRYETIIFGAWNKQETAKIPESENDNRTPQQINASTIRQFCGVSVLESIAKEKFGKARFVRASSKLISKRHFECGGTGEVMMNSDVRCTRCSRIYDQDANAARHLYGEQLGDRSNVEAAVVGVQRRVHASEPGGETN